MSQYMKCNNIDSLKMGDGATNYDFQRELIRLNRTQYFRNSITLFQKKNSSIYPNIPNPRKDSISDTVGDLLQSF